MGLLSLGTPLPWEESRNYNEHVRQNGLIQLINMFKAAYKRSNDSYLWGDEVEYTLIHFDNDKQVAKLNIDKDSILEDLNNGGDKYQLALDNNVNFHPEYGRFMLEATPNSPYDGEVLDQYLYVETNMNLRRIVANKSLNDPNTKPITITSFPLMGVDNFTKPDSIPNGDASRSLFLPDEIINRHVRFPTLTANIRKRRGEKVVINIPLYQDLKTPKFDDSIPQNRGLFPEDDEPSLGASIPNHIYLDAMGFGMGNSCLQVTVQAPNIARARYLYDSWANFTPIFLSLTAAAPVFKGFLADQDVRWNVISGSVDDRTPFERDVPPLRTNNEYGGIRPEDYDKVQKIPKSRYDGIDLYLGDLIQDKFDETGEAQYNFFSDELNDINPPINEKVYHQLITENPKLFDAPLAKHFAHLYIRDPIVIFNERIIQNNEVETDHFENIQSTNWQTLRFKPPSQLAIPSNNSTPGWRVEFRPMEIQLTDFENAAYSVFITLLGQAILNQSEDLNFYIPISQIESNLITAHKRDSILNSKFHFKKDLSSKGFETVELSIDEIINGNDSFIGLIQFVKNHLSKQFGLKELSPLGNYSRLYYYFQLISKRASGEIPTIAKFIRNFVLNHPSYKQDSKINQIINYELLLKFNHITNYSNLDYLNEFFGKEIGEYLFNSQTSGFVNGIH